jgi:light-regulated signal transduction histidine kinase (bacteriophytochrome)
MGDSEDDYKAQMYEIRYNIRETMQHVQLQFDILTHAVDSAIEESVKFIEFNVKLVKLMSELRSLVYSNKVWKKS